MKGFCFNCGKKGHIYNNCLMPVMSYGGILYRIDPEDEEPKYLLVQRTYTPDFKEIVRGKFELNDLEYIKKLIARLTLQEIDYILKSPHSLLYKNIQRYCRIKKNPLKYRIAKDNFNQLKHGYFINQQHVKFLDLVKEGNPNYYMEPDWGFPKGRRDYKGNENDIDCAIREIKEETGIGPGQYEFKEGYYVTEVHTGTNNVKYAHRYYLGKCLPSTLCFIDPFNKYQVGEIRKMAWFTIDEALALIRPYHLEKKKVLMRVHYEITGITPDSDELII